MNKLTLTFLAASLLAMRALAGDSLPFSVTVGGQAAKDGVPFAKLAEPVAANAAIEIGAKADLIIINVHEAKADGTPVEGGPQPAVILLQNTSKGSLDQSMDKRKFEPGKYFLSISAGEKTASIRFSIK